MSNAAKTDGNDIFLYQIGYYNFQKSKIAESYIIYKNFQTTYTDGSNSNMYFSRIEMNDINKNLNLDSVNYLNLKNSMRLSVLYCLPGIIYSYYNTIGFRKKQNINRLVDFIFVDDFCNMIFIISIKNNVFLTYQS